MTEFFHSYDLRGKYPKQISEEEAERVGKAYGSFIDANKVAVARDGRNHGSNIAKSFIKGIRSTGTNVVYLGVLPSPALYMYVYKEGLESGAVVTASHNPEEYTGFKFTKENALAMSREGGMKEIEKIYEDEVFEQGEGGLIEEDPKNMYEEFISEHIQSEKQLNITVNYGNGVVSKYSGIFDRLGHKEISINKEITGRFPNHLPDPGNKEAQEALREEMNEDTDLGIIFDGDGDRAGFILPEYGYIPEDEIIALLASEMLKENKGKVLYDLRGSKLVPEEIKNDGGIPQETRVGHTFISEKIHQDEEIVFAGELSGHYYFPGIDVPWDDGLLTAVLITNIAARGELREKLEEFPDYPVSPELRIDCPHKAKPEVIEYLKQEYSDHELNTKDGVKISFESGWALVRPSNTEEKMSVRCEAETEQHLNDIREEVEEEVRSITSELS